MSTETERTATPFEIINGGIEIIVIFDDGRNKAEQAVKVKQVPIRKTEALVKAWDDEVALVELATGLSPAKVDMLNEEDFLKLYEAAVHLHQDFLARWLARKAGRLAAVRPALAEAFRTLPTGLPK